MNAHQDLWLEVSGLDYHLDVWDGGGETTVVLLHGFLDLGRTWTQLVEALGEVDWHLVAPDWRGHGQTEWNGPGGYYHFADYARDLEQIVAAVRRERLVVVGHSLGAGAAVLWLGARPEAADGLALVDWPGPVGLEPEQYPERMRRFLEQTAPFHPEGFSRPMTDLGQAARRLSRVNPRVSPEQAERMARWATVEDGGQLRWRHDPLHRTRAPHPLTLDVVEAFWRRISCPVTWIGGAESGFASPSLGDFLDLLPHLERCSLPGAGHMVQNDRPEALGRVLTRFVDAVVRR